MFLAEQTTMPTTILQGIPCLCAKIVESASIICNLFVNKRHLSHEVELHESSLLVEIWYRGWIFGNRLNQKSPFQNPANIGKHHWNLCYLWHNSLLLSYKRSMALNFVSDIWNNMIFRRGLERLLRRLIGLDDSPGILYFHYWAPAKSHPGFLNDEDTINALLKYYSIPTISMRDALNTDLEQNPELLDKYWQPSPDPKIHPNCLGSR